MDEINQKFEIYNKGINPGLAVLVVKDGSVIYKTGFGLADIGNKSKINADTLFDIGSISKQFTAMAVAILENRGGLDVSDPVREYLSLEGDIFSEIKLYHLLHHVSGLPDFDDDLCFTSDTKPLIGNLDVVDYYTDQELDFKPGENFEYSNAGYVLLALVIEKVTGVSFQEFLKNEIFDPLGMSSTYVAGHNKSTPKQAKSYSDWPFFEPIDFNTCNGLYGDGRIYTSINDYKKWILSLENQELIDDKTTQKLFRSETELKGITKGYGYGYGWYIQDFYGHRIFTHSGGWLGFNSCVVKFSEQNLWIAVFANSFAVSSYTAFEDIAKAQLNIVT